MNVLHINTYDEGGGAEDFAYDFLIHNTEVQSTLLVKKKKGSTPNVIEFPKYFQDSFFDFADRFLWKLGIKKTTRQLFSLTEEYNSTFKKLRMLPQYKNADVVQLHNIHGGFFDLDALLSIALEKPIIWSLHDMWAFTGGEAYTFGNENYKKGIANTPFKDIYPLSGPLIDRRQHFLEKKKLIYRKIGKHLSVVPGSNWLAESFKSSFAYNADIHVDVINESIDTTNYKNLNQRSWKIPRVMIVNSSNPFKGSEVFAKMLPGITTQYELHVIGSKIEFNSSATITTYHPYLSKQELAKLYNEMDILIFPSKAENFSLVVLSAMSCGVCVFGSEVGGIPEQLSGNCGLLFDLANPMAAKVKLEAALIDLEGTRHIGKNASEKVRARYNTDMMYAKYNALYTQVVAHHRKFRETTKA